MRLPTLGVGIVYAPGLEPLLEAGRELVPVLEIEPQTLWFDSPAAPGRYRLRSAALDEIARLPQTKLIHGVGFPLGGSRAPDERSLPLLRTMIDRFAAPWTSEHLSFNEADGPDGPFRTGFMLPPRQSPAGAATAAATVRGVARRLSVPLAIETGVNYLRPRRDEMPDGSFAAEVAEQADCGLLLDLHNIYVNERNGRQPVHEFVRQLPLERVWEMHVAGGVELDGYLLDAHSGEVPEALMALAHEIVPMLPNLRALTFELMPDHVEQMGLDAIHDQLVALRHVWERRGTRRPAPAPAPPLARRLANRDAAAPGPSPAAWEAALGAQAIGRPASDALSRELAGDPGVAILRTLVGQVRAGMVADGLLLSTRLLALTVGAVELRSLLEDFWSTTAPQLFGAREAVAFADYILERRLDIPYLDDVLAFERALVRATVSDESAVVRFRHEPAPLLDALHEGRLPGPLASGAYDVSVVVEQAA
ncbi:MAG: uncharacterized protein QOE31_3901 [Solirubrobacteraceae bacterium]|nr:uncharacterized protein [Solirubrobacteraceae bacterium]